MASFEEGSVEDVICKGHVELGIDIYIADFDGGLKDVVILFPSPSFAIYNNLPTDRG